MRCYNCQTRVHCLEVRERDTGGSRRRYECKACGLRFTTLETLNDIDAPAVTAGGDRRSDAFQKLRSDALAQARKAYNERYES